MKQVLILLISVCILAGCSGASSGPEPAGKDDYAGVPGPPPGASKDAAPPSNN